MDSGKPSLNPACMFNAPSGKVDGLILRPCDRHQTISGKWERREASYADRRVRQRNQHVLVDQEKYILEKLHRVPLRERNRKIEDSPLAEFEQLRFLVFNISWVAKESGLKALLELRQSSRNA